MNSIKEKQWLIEDESLLANVLAYSTAAIEGSEKSVGTRILLIFFIVFSFYTLIGQRDDGLGNLLPLCSPLHSLGLHR